MSRAVALALVAWAGAASAHGSNPQAYAVVPQPGGKALVNTNLGTLITADDGATFEWICNDATGTARSPTPAWFLSGTGAVFVYDSSGLSVSRDGLCNFDRLTAFDGMSVAGMAKSPGALFAVTARYAQTNGIFKSTDDGASWAGPAPASATEFYSAMVISPSSPARMVASWWWFDPAYSMGLYRSDDGGANWTRLDLTAGLPAPGAFYVKAVHPTNPDILLGYVNPQANANSAIVVRSSDGGATWTRLFDTALVVSDMAFSADGSHAWVAAGNTLYESSDDGASFSALPAPTRDVCAATLGNTLYGCGNELIDGYVVARKTAGGTFAPFLNWKALTGQKVCPAGSSVEQKCTSVWPVAQDQIRYLRADVDGGAGGSGGTGGSGGGGVNPTPCGCSSARAALAAGAALLLLIGRRRPRRW